MVCTKEAACSSIGKPASGNSRLSKLFCVAQIGKTRTREGKKKKVDLLLHSVVCVCSSLDCSLHKATPLLLYIEKHHTPLRGGSSK